jgi:hypothetical protein
MTKQKHAAVLLRHSFIRASFVIGFSFVICLDSPNLLAFDLRTWFRIGGIQSASEVAKIDNGTNDSLNEESRACGTKQKCQEPLMPRPAGHGANASLKPPKDIAAADQNFSVTPKTRR